MRYSLYQAADETDNVFRLFIQTPESSFVRCFEFKSNIKAISNEDGITRLFGKEIFDIAGNYFLFPISTENVETGEFNLIEETPKVIRMNFVESDKTLQGEWILRRLSTGEFLFWKPFPIVAVMPTKNVDVSVEQGEVVKDIPQQFGLFDLETDGSNNFKGILAAEGIWTGADLHTTLFSDKMIVKLVKAMQDKIEDLIVDFNHSFENKGSVFKVELREERNIKYIWVEGVAQDTIPHGSGLSITLKSTLKWNSKLNVFALLEADPIGLAIMTENKPSCTICMIR